MRQRNALFAILVLGVAGCHLVTEFDEGKVETTERRTLSFDQQSNVSGLDLLVVVDTRSATQFSGFENGLRTFIIEMLRSINFDQEDPGVPPDDSVVGSLHVGFVSSDMGTPGAQPLPEGCTEDGRGASLIRPLPPPGHQGYYLQPFLVLRPDGDSGVGMGDLQVLNYRDAQGDASEIPFTEALAHQWAGVMATTTTCPFQQPLNAAQRALEYHVENLGFYRADAALGVLILAPGDDCSANPNHATALFSSDPGLGSLDVFRCFAHGVQCSGGDLASPGLKSDCQDLPPYEGDGPDGRVMIPAQSYRMSLEAKKGGLPFAAAVVIAPTSLIEVALDPQGHPRLQPETDCTLGDVSIYPAVRLRSFLTGDMFEWDLTRSLCDVDWHSFGDMFGLRLQAQAVDQCLGHKLVDTDPVEDGIQPDCTVQLVNHAGTVVAELQPCDWTSGFGMGPEGCWEVPWPEAYYLEDPPVPPDDGLVQDECPASLVVYQPEDLDPSQYEVVVAECTYSLR